MPVVLLDHKQLPLQVVTMELMQPLEDQEVVKEQGLILTQQGLWEVMVIHLQLIRLKVMRVVQVLMVKFLEQMVVEEVEDTLLEVEHLVIHLQQIHLKEIMVVTDLIKQLSQEFLLAAEVVVLLQLELMLLQVQEEMEAQVHLIQF